MLTGTTRVKDSVSIVDLDGKLIAGDALSAQEVLSPLAKTDPLSAVGLAKALVAQGRQDGAVAVLREAEKLPEPIFTPSTKAAVGDHDENIAFSEVEKLVGAERAGQIRAKALQLYSEAAEYADARGIIIADTKFEFGVDADGELYLIDEALTSDSSRFWPRDQYRVGSSPPSFDKQFVRDWLESRNWNKQPPAPALPDDILARTAAKYEEALRLLTE